MYTNNNKESRSNSEYWTKKNELAKKAKLHTEKMKEKYCKEIAETTTQSVIYREENIPALPCNPDYSANINIINKKSSEAIFMNDDVRDLKIAVLNFASYKNPGGKFLNGSSAQEESLCHDSFLYNVLSKMQDYYEENKRELNFGLYTDAAIYTPNVIFENDDTNQRRTCDVITCAAPNKNVAQGYCNISDMKNRFELEKRINFVLQIAAVNQVKILILGAFGCGVFGQNATEVATIFKGLLETTYKGYFYNVIFAIPAEEKYFNLDKFREVFFDKDLRHNRIYWSLSAEDFASMMSFVFASAGIDFINVIQDLNYRLKHGSIKKGDEKNFIFKEAKGLATHSETLRRGIYIKLSDTDNRYIDIWYKKAK